MISRENEYKIDSVINLLGKSLNYITNNNVIGEYNHDTIQVIRRKRSNKLRLISNTGLNNFVKIQKLTYNLDNGIKLTISGDISLACEVYYNNEFLIEFENIYVGPKFNYNLKLIKMNSVYKLRFNDRSSIKINPNDNYITEKLGKVYDQVRKICKTDPKYVLPVE